MLVEGVMSNFWLDFKMLTNFNQTLPKFARVILSIAQSNCQSRQPRQQLHGTGFDLKYLHTLLAACFWITCGFEKVYNPDNTGSIPISSVHLSYMNLEVPFCSLLHNRSFSFFLINLLWDKEKENMNGRPGINNEWKYDMWKKLREGKCWMYF